MQDFEEAMLIRRLVAIFAVVLMGLFGAMILAHGRGQNAIDTASPRHIRFDAKDRENVGEWYKQHQEESPRGLQADDRLSPLAESNLRIGDVLAPDLRPNLQPVPPEMLQRLTPVARGYRYEILDGHLLLLQDKTWKASDVLHFEQEFGRP
jgi:hypothetical protein